MNIEEKAFVRKVKSVPILIHYLFSPIMKQILTHIFLALVSLSTFLACQSNSSNKEKATFSHRREQMETEAQKRLQIARKQLAQNQCEAAKATIQQMRTDCYLALEARRQGILLMDSIDLKQARNDVVHADSVMRSGNNSSQALNTFNEACSKVQFYERKIQYDKRHSNN